MTFAATVRLATQQHVQPIVPIKSFILRVCSRAWACLAAISALDRETPQGTPVSSRHSFLLVCLRRRQWKTWHDRFRPLNDEAGESLTHEALQLWDARRGDESIRQVAGPFPLASAQNQKLARAIPPALARRKGAEALVSAASDHSS
jgi:hypothetical protein